MMPRLWTVVATAALLATALAGCGSTEAPGGSTPPPGEPTLFANTGRSPTQPIVHGGTLYWSETGEAPIRSRPIAGGATTTLAYRMGAPAALSVRGADVYWIDEQNGISPSGCGGFGQTRLLRKTSGATTSTLERQDACASLAPQLVIAGEWAYWVTATANNAQAIRRTPLAGGASTIVANSSIRITMIADAENLYWMESDPPPGTDGIIRSMPLAGGAAVTIATGFASRTGVFALSATSVVYAETAAGEERLTSVPLTGGAPTALGTVPRSPVKLVVAGAQIYWIDDATVATMPLAGGAPSVLATAASTPLDLAVRADDVLWSERIAVGVTGVIKRTPRGGGPVSIVVEETEAPSQLYADASWIYWAEGGVQGQVASYGRIARCPSGGGQQETIAAGVSSDSPSLSVNDNHVVFADGGTIKKVPIAGGMVETVTATVTTAGGRSESLVVDASNVYWVDPPLANVYRAPLVRGAATLLGTTGIHSGPGGPIRLQDGTIYWMSHYDAILSVPAAGGASTVVASGLPFLSDFVVDGQAIYWSEQDTGEIKRLPLSGGTRVTLANIGGGTLSRLAVDQSHLYWIDQTVLGRVPKGGGSGPEPLATGIPGDVFTANALALDQESVFFTVPPLQVVLALEKVP